MCVSLNVCDWTLEGTEFIYVVEYHSFVFSTKFVISFESLVFIFLPVLYTLNPPLWSFLFCLETPSSASLVQYIHHPSSAHVKPFLTWDVALMYSFLILSILGQSQWKFEHLHLCQLQSHLLSFLSVHLLQTKHRSSSHDHLLNLTLHSCCYSSVKNHCHSSLWAHFDIKRAGAVKHSFLLL